MIRAIDKLIRKALWVCAPAAFAIVCAFAANSALQSDGLFIGHPKTRVVYVNAPQDVRLQQLAEALPKKAYR